MKIWGDVEGKADSPLVSKTCLRNCSVPKRSSSIEIGSGALAKSPPTRLSLKDCVPGGKGSGGRGGSGGIPGTAVEACAVAAVSFIRVLNFRSYSSFSSSAPHDLDQFRYREDFPSNFTSLYHSIFPPKSPLPRYSFSPSASSSSSDDFHALFDPISDSIATDSRLNQARLILEYQEICQHYDLCLARLQVISGEIGKLRRENADLRLTNSELVKSLSLSSQAAMKRNLQIDEIRNFSMPSERRNIKSVEYSSLPKSISVRTDGHPKVNQQLRQGPSRVRVATPLAYGSVQQRVYAPAEDHPDEEALELDVYNQGTTKTELCNKWQETGSCPYRDRCQFAHGISELRPVIRHPRYKTDVCKMVLAGRICPYGQRCHFRHSLTEEERMLADLALI